MSNYFVGADVGSYAYGSPLGHLSVAVEGGGAVVGVGFAKCEGPPLAGDHPRLASAFDRYFSDAEELAAVPVSLRVSDFMAIALEGIRSIPRGQVRSYAEVARLIGRPGSARAVGRACAANPVPIIIPCHRVLGSQGPGGYQNGLNSKFYLLRLERFHPHGEFRWGEESGDSSRPGLAGSRARLDYSTVEKSSATSAPGAGPFCD